MCKITTNITTPTQPNTVQQTTTTAPLLKRSLDSNSLQSISKEQFSSIGNKIEGGEKALLNKLKEIEPVLDFEHILNEGHKIELSSENQASLKEFILDNAAIKSRKLQDSTDLNELKTNKPVTTDTTKSEVTLGDGKTKNTVLTGKVGTKLSDLEDKMNNPIHTTDRERLSLPDRQKKIMEVAKQADPLMKEIESGRDLSDTHSGDGLSNKGNVKTGYSFNSSDTLIRDSDNKEQYSYGAEEYGNRTIRGSKTQDKTTKVGGVTTITPKEWANTSDAVETTVPKLTNHPGTTAGKGDGVKARVGVWSEADTNPRVKDTTATGSVQKAKGRDAERLLFTHKDSEVEDQVSISKTSTTTPNKKKVDYQFHVTSDHYQTTVPITPVQENYKTNNPYTPKYDKKGNEIPPPTK